MSGRNDLDETVVQRLPKVSLHDHLDGGLRPETVLELADAADIDLPVTDADELADWFVPGDNERSLPEYLTRFDLSTAVMQTPEALTRVAREFVEDLADDGVVYGEVRWAPEQHLTTGLSLDEVVDAVQEGIEQGEDRVSESGGDIQVNQILCAMRHTDRSMEIAQCAVAFRDLGVVGFDIAGPEHGFPPSKHREAFEYLAEQFFPTTVHAGEADGLDSLRSAVIDGRACRLGHGVRLAEDIRAFGSGDADEYECGDLAAWVRDRQIALELCPTSNLQTGACAQWGEDIEAHPFDLLYRLGFAVTVNVDNRTVSGTTLTDEMLLLAETFDYTLDDLEVFHVTAARAAFLPADERDELVELITDGFAR